MNNWKRVRAGVVAAYAMLMFGACCAFGGGPIQWPEFLRQHDMLFKELPQNWKEAPHFGNAMIGSMLYEDKGAIRLEIFRNDVHDHRDNSYGWTAYSRPRLRIGSFYLKTVGKPLSCEWRKELWNAELYGVIKTDRGEIKIRHFVHAMDMAIVTEIETSAGEKGATWNWEPVEATTTRSGYPKKKEEIAKFAKRYGDHYNDTLKVYTPNPAGKLKAEGKVQVWVQDFLAGGQYATAWTELDDGKGQRTLMVTITNSYPEMTAGAEAVESIKRFSTKNMDQWVKEHRKWWHGYYPKSFVSIGDKAFEGLYWQTIYRYGCNARTGRSYIDTPGMWTQGGPWPYTTNDHNTQVAHWAVYTANRLEQGQELVDTLHRNRQNMIDSVLPEEWQKDSAYLHVTTARDMYGPRNQDKRYYNLVGCLPWLMHNCWMQYRYSMDDRMLREKIYPLLRRSINMYLHMVVETPEGKITLPPTYSPETHTVKDCNFDLGLLKWGCMTLLEASERLGIDDPLKARWQDVIDRMVDYPVDEFGFRLGSDRTSPSNHRHGSHFLMAYPLYTYNIEQNGTEPVLRATLERFIEAPGYPAMRASYSGPLAAAIGDGEMALNELQVWKGDLHPNGLWFSFPCLEVSLSGANIMQDMLLQSWGGIIRVFPAVPAAWPDVVFQDLRTQGAFLVSAVRRDGKTQFVRIKSLAGEPCRIKPALTGKIHATGDRTFELTKLSNGLYELDIKKGEEAILWTGSELPDLSITALP